jgi:hypothetical protein
MRKLVAIVLILFVVALNISLLLPKPSANTGAEECSAVKWPKIKQTEINFGIIPNLLKS